MGDAGRDVEAVHVRPRRDSVAQAEIQTSTDDMNPFKGETLWYETAL